MEEVVHDVCSPKFIKLLNFILYMEKLNQQDKLEYYYKLNDYIYNLKKEYGLRVTIIVTFITLFFALNISIYKTILETKDSFLFQNDFAQIISLTLFATTTLGSILILFIMRPLDKDPNNQMSTKFIAGCTEYENYISKVNIEYATQIEEILLREIYANSKVQRQRSNAVALSLVIAVINFIQLIVILGFQLTS